MTNCIKAVFTVCWVLAISGCIETDYIEEPGFSSQVIVSPAQSTVQPGDTVLFEAVYYDESGDPVAGVQFNWSCSDTLVAQAGQDGSVSGLAEGQAFVRATAPAYGKTDSALLTVAVGGGLQSRTGVFSGSGNYDVAGTVVLAEQEAGNLLLSFEDDFESDNGPGLYVYLSSDSFVNSGSLELGPLKTTSGSQSYFVPLGTGVFDFDFVIIHCKPFNARFGSAALN